MLQATSILLSGFLIPLTLTLSFHNFTVNGLWNILLSPAGAQSTAIDEMEEPSAAARGTVFGKDSRPFSLTYGDWTAR
jgi:hypothetical protein